MGEIYLKKETLKNALKLFKDSLRNKKVFKKLKEEEISVYESLGRITSRPVIAKISNPFFNASAVDGFALKSHETANSTINNPKIFKIGLDAIPVNTGDPINFPFDCVAMIEDVEVNGDFVKIFSPLHIYENVRVIGEDFAKGEIVIPIYEKITPAHIGVLISSYNEKVYVFEKPKVLIMATGEEVKRLGEDLKVGDVIDSNSYMISSILKEYGADPYILEKVLPNNFEVLKNEIEKASQNYHMIIVIGGSAKGRKDLISDVFESFSEVLFHGLTIQPGKPLVIGFYGDVPLVGSPGFPVSSYIDAKIFLKVAIEEFTGISLDLKRKIIATIKRDIPSSLGVEEFVRVKLNDINGEVICVPLKRGAANLTSVVKGDGLLRIEENSEGIIAGSKVEIELLKSEYDILSQLLFIGSNDPLLEYILNMIRKENPQFKFGIINVGSLGGLLSLARGETIITSIHLFDSETQTYNTPYLKKYLEENSYLRIHLFNRNQGLVVQKGNPKNIRSLKDLEREDLKFINRQKGSGTRIYFDYLLSQNGIEKEKVKGYDLEETTHLGVANAVKEGIVDCGMGIEYVARLFDLDFIKLGEEEYEIIISKNFLEDHRINFVLKQFNALNLEVLMKSFEGYKWVNKVREV
ncbi:molybdopterin biosynthesis protein [Caldisericum exile]|uniref:Molybdopterin molybdenumtransferase n=1 Tax=Caldisericum exile (strain DSM 21853 / NBRC 104410 / AZM16c01) TaxID=511051 RepID=A0A7U6JG18_CALEA|nr:molybdopterin biosynthesis protein [Caldisericum exile]BAL80900.1 putative molybdopterin biosynthesis protein [Caldisericum exile AZM16c01]